MVRPHNTMVQIYKVYSQTKQNLNAVVVPQLTRFRAYCLIVAVITLPLMVWHTYTSSPHYYEDLDYVQDLTDYAHLLKFQIFEDVCRDSSPLLLILVHSAPDHFLRRKSIRETWGRNTNDVKTIFLLGLTQPYQTRALILENAQHKDLVQGSFIDTYRNLTYKHMMALKYVTYHCPKAKYVLKADDDVFVNIQDLLTFLTAKFSPPGDLIFCKTKEASPVNRDPNYKWGVSIEEYPGENFPRYCWGFMVIYSSGAMSKLYRAALQAEFFWIDDIHVTGTLAKMNGLSQTDAAEYVMNFGDVTKVLRGSEVNRKLLFGFNLAEKTVRRLWKCYA